MRVKRPKVTRAGMASGLTQKVNQETMSIRKAGIYVPTR